METFQERFQRLVAPLSDTELALTMGVSADAARKMRRGDIKTLKLEAALLLCERLGIDPYQLAFGRAAMQPTSVGADDDLGKTVSRLAEAVEVIRQELLANSERQQKSIEEVQSRLAALEEPEVARKKREPRAG